MGSEPIRAWLETTTGSALDPAVSGALEALRLGSTPSGAVAPNRAPRADAQVRRFRRPASSAGSSRNWSGNSHVKKRHPQRLYCMDCEMSEAVMLLADGEMEPGSEEANRVRLHLADCEPCRTVLTWCWILDSAVEEWRQWPWWRKWWSRVRRWFGF